MINVIAAILCSAGATSSFYLGYKGWGWFQVGLVLVNLVCAYYGRK